MAAWRSFLTIICFFSRRLEVSLNVSFEDEETALIVKGWLPLCIDPLFDVVTFFGRSGSRSEKLELWKIFEIYPLAAFDAIYATRNAMARAKSR